MAIQPGQIGNIVPKRNDPGAIMRMIRQLQDDVKALQGGLTLNGLTIGSGGLLTIDGDLQVNGSETIADSGNLTVLDNLGNPRTVLGLLANGDFGLEVISSGGTIMPLSQLAFGAAAIETPATFNCLGNATFRVDPLESALAVNVVTGRLLVTVSAVAFSSLSASNVCMSWTLTGPTAVAASNQRGLVVATAGYPAAGYGSGSYSYLHTGLTPGSYSIRANYRTDDYGGSTDTGSFENRAIIALPF